MSKEKDDIKNRLEDKIKELGIEELILLCPNCYYYFKHNLNIKVSMIYEHEDLMCCLISKDLSNKIDGLLFLPCPDKDQRIIYKMIEKYLYKENIQEIKDIQCCGVGGCASIKENQLTQKLQDEFKDYEKNIHLYCATCSGMITKSTPNVEHVLCKLLNTNEKISTGISTLKNRVIFSIKGAGK